MILRSLTRRPQAISALAQRACRPPPARHLHRVPSLLNQDELDTNGIPGLLSKEGFNIAYTQYQSHIINELNTATNGTEYENTDPKSLLVNVARDPTHAYLFNLASMAFNNHFFFRGIQSNPTIASAPSAQLTPLINQHFTSLSSLRETFLLTADAMFGPGFVWLVQTDEGSSGALRILTTYLAGSPISAAHYRQQGVDANTLNAGGENYAGAFGNSARRDAKPKKPLGGVDVTPLLCVNTWEHVYLRDYGVAGKMEYLERWWGKIDWALAEQFVSKGSGKVGSAGQGFRQFYGN